MRPAPTPPVLAGLILVTAVVALGLAAGAPAHATDGPDPTPTPAPTATPAPSPTPQARSMAEAARQTQAGAAGTPTPGGIVISNDNLAEYAAKGHLTTGGSSGARADGELGKAPRAVGAAADQGPPDDPEGKKAYWRDLIQEQLDTIAALEEELAELERRIPELERKFYAWDDPHYRDGVIKPEWDRALERHAEVTSQLEEERKKLPELRTRARQNGALPGWFRDLYPDEQPRP
jgi:hypothetical protein